MIASIYRDFGTPYTGLTPAVLDATCAVMDRIAKRDVAAAVKAGNITASQRAHFNGTARSGPKAVGGKTGGKVSAQSKFASVEADRARKLHRIVSLIADPNRGGSLRALTGYGSGTLCVVTGRAEGEGLILREGRPSAWRWRITPAGRAWLEARK